MLKPSAVGQLPTLKSTFLHHPIAKVVNTFTLTLMLAASANSQVQQERQNSEAKDASDKTGAIATQLKTVRVNADAVTESSSAQLDYLTNKVDAGALGNKTVLDTPFSLTVIDSTEIITRGAKSIGQIFVNDPSVYAPTPSAQTDWWGTQIRGLPVRNFYVDDIPMLLYWGGDFPTEAAESITALKGLTGFMYGFGEPGGAISYKVKRPTETPETFVNLGYRNAGVFSAHIDTSQNIGDEFAFRTNLVTEQGTAYNKSEIDRTLLSLSLDKNFGESINWFTSVIYEKNKIKGEPLQFYFSAYDVQGSGGKLPDVTYDYGNFNIDNSYYDTETTTVSTGVDWELNDQWTLKYKIGFSRKEHQSNKTFADLLNKEGDYQGNAYNFAGQLDNHFNQAILQGDVATGAVKHEIVGGVGKQKSTDRWGTEWYWENDFNGNLYERQTFRITRTPDFTLESKPSNEVTQTYAFASDTIHFNEHWQTIIGLRYTDYEQKTSDYGVNKTSPTLALIYKPTSQTSFYGSYVEALEPGTLVGEMYANRGEVLGATVSKQYEIGIKHSSGKFNYTAAIFNTERANQMDSIRGGLKYLTQDGLEIYKGIEFSTSYKFSDHLNLGLGALYLDGTIDKVSAENAAMKGNDPAYAADWQFVGNFEYKVAGIQGLKLHGNARYFGESYTDSNNSLVLPSRTIVNTGASYEFKSLGQLWVINANVNNLLNEKYWAGGGWSAGNMGEARNISLGLNTTF
jgi:iron complex outermembrane receptor protein